MKPGIVITNKINYGPGGPLLNNIFKIMKIENRRKRKYCIKR